MDNKQDIRSVSPIKNHLPRDFQRTFSSKKQGDVWLTIYTSHSILIVKTYAHTNKNKWRHKNTKSKQIPKESFNSRCTVFTWKSVEYQLKICELFWSHQFPATTRDGELLFREARAAVLALRPAGWLSLGAHSCRSRGLCSCPWIHLGHTDNACGVSPSCLREPAEVDLWHVEAGLSFTAPNQVGHVFILPGKKWMSWESRVSRVRVATRKILGGFPLHHGWS